MAFLDIGDSSTRTTSPLGISESNALSLLPNSAVAPSETPLTRDQDLDGAPFHAIAETGPRQQPIPRSEPSKSHMGAEPRKTIRAHMPSM